MDARHESFQQEVFNQLITVINYYVKNNIDYLLGNQLLQEQMKLICEWIYVCSKVQVDIDSVLSKHNLLSVDVVPFPLLTKNPLLVEEEFLQFVAMLKKIETEDAGQHFHQEIRQILIQHQL